MNYKLIYVDEIEDSETDCKNGINNILQLRRSENIFHLLSHQLNEALIKPNRMICSHLDILLELTLVVGIITS